MRKVWEEAMESRDLNDVEFVVDPLHALARKFNTFDEFSRWIDNKGAESESGSSDSDSDSNSDLFSEDEEIIGPDGVPVPRAMTAFDDDDANGGAAFIKKKKRKKIPQNKTFNLQLSDEESEAMRMIKKRVRKKKKKRKVYVRPNELESIFSQLVEMEVEYEKKKRPPKEFEFDEAEYYKEGPDESQHVSKIGAYAEMLKEKLRQKKKKVKRVRTPRKPAKFEFNNTVEMLQKHCTLDLMKMKFLTKIWVSIVGDADTMTMNELVCALQKVNKNLIGKDVLKYLFFVLDLIGHDGQAERVIDFKLFAAIAALSEKTAPMEDLYNDFLDTGDLGSLKKKMDLAHRMFEGIFMIDDEFFMDGIPLRLLEMELFAGGYHKEEIDEILNALRANNMDPMSFLDYLVYVPMFVEIHKKIMENPIGWKPM